MDCPACHRPNPPGLTFCGECGSKLATELSILVSPEAYTPKHLAEKILTSRSALEGERKQVSVAGYRDCFVQFVLSAAKNAPLVMGIEDLHWLDRSSEECRRPCAFGAQAHPIPLQVPLMHSFSLLAGEGRGEGRVQGSRSLSKCHSGVLP